MVRRREQRAVRRRRCRRVLRRRRAVRGLFEQGALTVSASRRRPLSCRSCSVLTLGALLRYHVQPSCDYRRVRCYAWPSCEAGSAAACHSAANAAEDAAARKTRWQRHRSNTGWQPAGLGGETRRLRARGPPQEAAGRRQACARLLSLKTAARYSTPASDYVTTKPSSERP